MRRRQLLMATGSGGVASIAGCSDLLGDDGPAYSADEKEDMLLTIDAFPDGWERDDSLNEHWDRAFISGDEEIIVLVNLEIFDSIDDARDKFAESKSSYRDPQEFDIGDEAFWDTRDEEIAYTIFRDSNAKGQAAAMREGASGVQPRISRDPRSTPRRCTRAGDVLASAEPLSFLRGFVTLRNCG